MDQMREFQETVWAYYAQHGRSMPWRNDHSPYSVLVSELMLQQTQVSRVIPKYESFMVSFPTIGSLADAPLNDILIAWQGLGYNRRAKYLHQAAQMVVREYDGQFPITLDGLMTLPGVGKNTAGAIMAYAFDKTSIFIETNIRTVLFHHFFDGNTVVDDKELMALIQASLPVDNYREWYWALMDYGSYLKKTAGGRLDQSRHYKKQSPLKGSIREVRGQIVRELTSGPKAESSLREQLNADQRFDPALAGLIRDGLIMRTNGDLGLTAD